MRRRALFAAGLLCAVSLPASETVTYSYDARGRLIQVSRSGTVNDGVQASYSYDKADNRTNVTVSAPGQPDFTVNDISATEGSALVFTVTRGGPTAATVSVNYATANGTATAGSDYTATSGMLTFTGGQTTKTVSVTTTNDTAVESAETVNLTFSGATGGATISDAQGVGTINDDDTPTCGVSFAIGDAVADEGGPLVFTVTKSGSTAGSCSVDYATAAGTAGTGDFTAVSGTLTFASNETSKTVSVTTIDNMIVESTEQMYLNLSNASGGATISDAQGVGTINDNDDPNPCPLC